MNTSVVRKGEKELNIKYICVHKNIIACAVRTLITRTKNRTWERSTERHHCTGTILHMAALDRVGTQGHKALTIKTTQLFLTVAYCITHQYTLPQDTHWGPKPSDIPFYCPPLLLVAIKCT